MRQLYCLAKKKSITVRFDNSLSPVTPSASDSATRRIIINENWHDQQQLPFQFAHEIAHVLHGDSTVLYFTPSKAGIEGLANRGAVKLLVPLYFAETEPCNVNLWQFMTDLAIPEWLADDTEHLINDAYGCKER